MLPRVALLACLSTLGPVASGQQPKGAPAAPKSLLVFYGWPSTINGVNGNLAQASANFAAYDIVVIGGGLEDPTHADHAKTKLIIQAAGKTRFYGYVPLGNRKGQDKSLTDKEIAARIALVSKLGAKGVLLDEFGFDYGVDRKRQNAAVKAAHDKKLAVIANAWQPDDVFLPDVDGLAPTLTTGDAYLWESYRLKEGKPVDLKEWRAKADKVAAGRKALALSVYSLSTNTAIAAKDTELFAHQWFSAVIDEHDATGWGYPGFGAGDSKAPFLTTPDKRKPSVIVENRANSAAQVNGDLVSKATDKGMVEVDVEKLTGKFSPKKGK